MLSLLSHACEVCLRKCVIQAQATGQSLTPLHRLAQARAECSWQSWPCVTGHSGRCEGCPGSRYQLGSPWQINTVRGSPSPAWAGTITKVSAALGRGFLHILPALSQSKGKWSLCLAGLNPSAVPWISTAKCPLMQKKLCSLKVFWAHTVSEWLSLCCMPCFSYDRKIWHGMKYSNWTQPGSWCDNNPPLGKWDPWHWFLAACQYARAWDGDEKTSWEQKKQQSFNWERKIYLFWEEEKKKRKPAFRVFFYWCKHTQKHSKSGFRVKCPLYYRPTVKPWAFNSQKQPHLHLAFDPFLSLPCVL